MKRKYVIVSAVALVVSVVLYINFGYVFTGKKLVIAEVATRKYHASAIAKGFELSEWAEIYDSNKRQEWIQAGYDLPDIDFSQQFIIISRTKIKSFYTIWDDCLGAFEGVPSFDYFNSDKDLYYIYTIPPIRLTQTIG